MKRNTVILVALCLMMIAISVAVSAKQDGNLRQAGKSSIYFYDIEATDSHGSGQLVIDMDKHTFVFHGKDFTPSTRYSLQARTVGGILYVFASGKSTPSGNLHIGGMWAADAPPAEVATTTEDLPIYGFCLENYGWFVVKIACYFSEDDGATWTESGHTDGIAKGDIDECANFVDLGVPYGALVKIHAIVVGGKDRTGDRIYRYSDPSPYYPYADYCYACYAIDGVTWNPDLVWFIDECWNSPK